MSAPPEQRWLNRLLGQVRRYAARADDFAVRIEQGRVVAVCEAGVKTVAGRGLQPVWRAEEANTASMRLPESLGFEPVDRLALMSRPL